MFSTGLFYMKIQINTFLKYILSLLICISVIFSSLHLFVVASTSETVPSTTTISETIYYELDSVDDIYWFAEQVNSGNTTINAILTDNIIVNKKVLTDGALNTASKSDFRSWTPIGSAAYSGIFDGNGYIISGLYLKADYKPIGLFGNNEGTIKNIVLNDVYFYEDDNEGSTQPIGGICAYNSGIISNCSILGNLSASASDRDGASVTIGGVCGYNSGLIEYCYNNASIYSSAGASRDIATTYAGGISGKNYGGTIKYCYNTGRVSGDTDTNDWLADATAGGICGLNDNSGKLENCCNTATVYAYGEGGREAFANATTGGICGNNYKGTVTECYNTGDLTSDTYISGNDGFKSAASYTGGIVGNNSSGATVSRCSNIGNLTATSYALGGYDIHKGNLCGYNGGSETSAYYTSTSFSNGTVCTALTYHCYNDGTCSLCSLECTGHQFGDRYVCLNCGKVLDEQVSYGDANGDGEIDVLDLTELKKLILSGETDYESNIACDVKADKKIDILDLVRLKKYFAGVDVSLGKS